MAHTSLKLRAGLVSSANLALAASVSVSALSLASAYIRYIPSSQTLNPLHRRFSTRRRLLTPLSLHSTSASSFFSTSSTSLATNNTDSLSLRDDRIPFQTVQIVQDDNSLSSPTPLRQILSTYSPKTHTLMLVSQDPPIVKLQEKAALRKNEREKKLKERVTRRNKVDESEVQVTWECGNADLDHKIKQAREIIEKHVDRVQLVLSPKAPFKGSTTNPDGTPKPIPDLTTKQKHIVEKIKEELLPVSRLWRQDNHTHKTYVIYFEPIPSVKQEKSKRLEQEVEVKMREKEKKKEERRLKEEERRKKAEEKRKADAAALSAGLR